MSVACTRIHDKPLSTSLRGMTKDQGVQQQPQPTRRNHLEPDRERNPRSVASCAGKLDQRDGRPVPNRFSISTTSETGQSVRSFYASKYERAELLSSDPRWRALSNPAVEQLAMIGRRQAIPEQDHLKSTTARLASSLRRAVSPDAVTLGGLGVRNHKVETTKCR